MHQAAQLFRMRQADQMHARFTQAHPHRAHLELAPDEIIQAHALSDAVTGAGRNQFPLRVLAPYDSIGQNDNSISTNFSRANQASGVAPPSGTSRKRQTE